MTTIYLDMDGVCADFIKSAMKIFKREDLYTNWPKGIYNVEEAIGISPAEFWKEIGKGGYKFWSTLEELPEFKEMYAALLKIGDVYFCTSPSRDPDSLKGKLMWLQDRFGGSFRNYIFIKDKHLLAKKDSFLIDDFDENCEKFLKAGGNSILFPQDWNSNNGIKNKISFVLDSIKNRI